MNTKIKALRRNYTQLGALDRFRLVLAAGERGDESEVDALAKSAPKATYTMQDGPYRGMVEGAHLVTWCAVTDLLLNAAPMLLAWGLLRAGGVPKPEEVHRESTEEERNHWGDTATLAGRVIATWDGLALFCEGLGVTLEAALKTAPAGDRVGWVVDFARLILAMDDDFAHWLASDYLGPDDGELEAVFTEREARTAEHRRKAAEEEAALFRELWDVKAQED